MFRRLTFGAIIGVALLVASALPAQAANTISGTLSKSGYTVVAVATTGKTVSVDAHGKKFSLKAPSKYVTLHLVESNGKYAGPVVVGKKGKKAILGVKKGAQLGKVNIKSAFAVTKKPLPKQFQLSTRVAPVSGSGAPVGAAGFGLIGGAPKMTSQKQQRARGHAEPQIGIAGEDPDKDGIPSTLDIDANGNSVIDMLDPQAPTESGLRSFVNYFAPLNETANVNADAASAAQIDQRMEDLLELVFLDIPVGAQLDCLGLPWCKEGGTGVITPYGSATPFRPASTPFPGTYIDAATGFPDIYKVSNSGAPGSSEFRLWPRAASSQIKTGDMLIERKLQADGSYQEVPGTLGFVFNTVAATKAWSTPTESGSFTYPAAEGSKGTQPNPVQLAESTTSITLTFWRPQRAGISGAGEAGWMDIGGLKYDVQAFIDNKSGTGGTTCGAGSLSSTDSNLVLGTEAGTGSPFLTDQRPDITANSANTLSFTVDLAKCASNKGLALTKGSVINLGLQARSPAGGGNDHVVQNLYFSLGTPIAPTPLPIP